MNSVPFNDEFERAVLVSALQDPLLFPKIQGIIETSDFYKEKHKEIFKAMSDMEVDNLDSLSVQDKLKAETATYFKELVQDSEKLLPSISNALFYAETIKQKSKLRSGIELGQQIIATCYQENDAEEAIHQLEDMFAYFLQKRVIENKTESTKEAFKLFLDNLNNRKPDDPDAIKTGFRDLDLMIQRLEGLIILAARPGMGKTAMAINVAANVARNHPVLFFSLEQSQDQVFERILSSESGVPLEDIRLGVFDPDQLETGKHKALGLMENIHVDDKADVATSHVTSVSRQKRYEWGKLGLIIVDYLHIMKLNDKQTVDALGDATKELRALGKELDCPVLLLSQLSRATEGRDAKKNRRPELSDLRSSGEIEQSADIVIFIYRESYYDQAGLAPDEDISEIIVRKNRNGRQGNILLEWHPKIAKFTDTGARYG